MILNDGGLFKVAKDRTKNPTKSRSSKPSNILSKLKTKTTNNAIARDTAGTKTAPSPHVVTPRTATTDAVNWTKARTFHQGARSA